MYRESGNVSRTLSASRLPRASPEGVLAALCLLIPLLSLPPAHARAAALAPAGDLSVVGTVMVDGAQAGSGQTIFSGSTVETAEGVLSTISLGKTGRVELSAESGLRLVFNDSNVNATLNTGRARVSVPAGVSAKVATAFGEVVADPRQPSLFTVDVRGGRTVVSMQSGRAELRVGEEVRQIGAGESVSSDAGDAAAQTGGGHNFAGGKKKWLFFALAGGIATILIFALTGSNNNTTPTPVCTGPIVPSGNTGGPCG